MFSSSRVVISGQTDGQIGVVKLIGLFSKIFVENVTTMNVALL
jgi:hypothetical protein